MQRLHRLGDDRSQLCGKLVEVDLLSKACAEGVGRALRVIAMAIEAPVDEPAGTGGIVLPDGGVSLREVERELVRQALDRTAGNQTRAAKLLRISRDALRYKMKSYGLGS